MQLPYVKDLIRVYDTDPGHIENFTVFKYNKDDIAYDLVQTGTEWVEYDIGDWRGSYKVEKPIYTKVEISRTPRVKWIALTDSQLNQFMKAYE